MSLSKVLDAGVAVTAPVFVGDVLHVVTSASGNLARVEDGKLVPVLETNGQPSGAATDPTTGEVFLTDTARQAIVKMETDAAGDAPPQLVQFLEQFEGKQFRGPHGVTFDANGELYFTDAGSTGDTGLHNPRGVVYRTVQGRQQVVAMCPPTLAFPTGIAAGPNGCIYVCELHANRVLRFAQRPAGVYHASVFVQMAGGVGPMAIAVHQATGDVYVAKYDFASAAGNGQGSVVVFTAGGEERGSISVPSTEITGITFDTSGTSLYITERTNVHSIEVAAQ